MINRQIARVSSLIVLSLSLGSLTGDTLTLAAETGGIAAAAQRLMQKENEKFGKYQDAVQLIHRNASTFESKNYDAYMDTLSADCEGRELTEDVIKTVNALDLDLKIEIVSFEVLPGGTDSKVNIDCVQTTEKVGGKSRFADNKMHVIHTVVQTEDGWKIGKSNILSIHMLHDED